MAVRNRVEIRMFGMRRSGNHMAALWLAHHFESPVWFVNNVSSFEVPEVRQEDAEGVYAPSVFRSPIGVDRFWEMEKDVLVHTYEDYWLNSLRYGANKVVVGESATEHDVLVVRDPFNLFSSRMFIHGDVVPMDKPVVALWKQYLHEALGDTRFLKRKVVVDYNRLVASPEYRRSVEARMGLSASDSGLDRVYGIGSSFDGTTYDGRAAEMRTMERWTAYASHPWYHGLFDTEVMDLAVRMWGKTMRELAGKVGLRL
jgi:hypothetical protein